VASEFDLVLGAIALAFDEDGLCVMQQPVQQRRGEHGIVVENAGPVLVDAIRRHQRGAALVAVADDLEQAVGAELVDGQVPKLIDFRSAKRESTYVPCSVMWSRGSPLA